MEGRISDNVIGNNLTPNSANEFVGIRVLALGAGDVTALIDNNQIRGVGQSGIVAQMNEATTATTEMNVTITGNVIEITDPDGASGIEVTGGAAAGSLGTVRVDIGGAGAASNTISNAGLVPGVSTGILIRKRGSVDVILPDYAGGPADNAAVDAYLLGRNDILLPPETNPSAVIVSSTSSTVNAEWLPGTVPQPNLPSALMIGMTGNGPGDGGPLSQADLDLIVEAAVQRWVDAGVTLEQLASLRGVSVIADDLVGPYVASSSPGVIRVDSDGAGHGWFIDTTPFEDSEFEGTGTRLTADEGGAAAGKIDLLTVIMHELCPARRRGRART